MEAYEWLTRIFLLSCLICGWLLELLQAALSLAACDAAAPRSGTGQLFCPQPAASIQPKASRNRENLTGAIGVKYTSGWVGDCFGVISAFHKKKHEKRKCKPKLVRYSVVMLSVSKVQIVDFDTLSWKYAAYSYFRTFFPIKKIQTTNRS